VKQFLWRALRIAYVGVVTCAGVFLGVYLAQRSTWYKELLYRRLVSGDEQKCVRAATMLVQFGGEKQLIAALAADPEPARKVAKRALEFLWLNAAGSTAYQDIELAYGLMEKHQYQEALLILDGVVKKFPNFAEGWNQRACVLWRLDRFEESMRDSQRTLALNPRHYGAWQGLGICQLKLGRYEEAVRSFRKALEFLPHDEPTRSAVRECERAIQNDHSKPLRDPVYA